jgi:hypothetical protein
MKDRSNMTRICSACGIEKPLAAFLEISGTHGTHYGAICSACRGAGITGKKILTPEEESTMSTTGNRIGSKERIFGENEQKKQLAADKQERIDQLAKRDALNQDKTDKATQKDKQEKDHRRTYLDLKKQPGFLGKKLPLGTMVNRIPTQHNMTAFIDAQRQEEKRKLQTKEIDTQFNVKEERKKTFNLMDQHVDAQAGEIRSHNPEFLAAQGRAEMTPYKLAKERLNKLSWTHNASDNKAQPPSKAKDALVTFVEQTWQGPSSGRKR